MAMSGSNSLCLKEMASKAVFFTRYMLVTWGTLNIPLEMGERNASDE